MGLQRVFVAEVTPLLMRLASLFLLISLVGCADRSAPVAAADDAGADCTLRVIASFVPSDTQEPPDASFLQQLSRDTGVELTYVRSLTPALHVLMLSADDPDDADCQRALQRLRSDARVRSADIDQRRQPQR
jgi:hypothetical protein